ncbi:MAG: HAD-IIA family hydrolase [Clostridia bacterium]|nr:HAD-IIA family hydrolase [Clostridia bacterium]
MIDYYGKRILPLKEKKLILFDMDGTIYIEGKLFEGVVDLLMEIKKQGGRYAFISNNSSLSVRDYVKKLARMGICASDEEFFTSAQASAYVLKKEFGKALIYCQGTRSFLAELRRGGLNVTPRYTEKAAAILVGYDSEITAYKMRKTCRMLGQDIPYFAANPDLVYPVSFGYVPDCGSMCEGYAHATGRTPQFIGKPQPTMIEVLMEKFGASKEQTVVFGDRLYTDIASGVNAGVDTVCVLSGEVKIEDVEKSEIEPTYVLQSVSEVLKVLKE